MRRHRRSPDDLDALARRAGRGDRRSAEAFVRATQADVWRLCAHLGDSSDTEDLTQETYARALRALPGFRGDSSAKTWLLAIAKNVCADHARRAVSRRRTATRLAQRRQPARRPGDVDPDEVWMLVRELPDSLRSALVLTQVLGLSYEECAEVCGVPIGTIRSRVARAREALLDDGNAGVAADR